MLESMLTGGKEAAGRRTPASSVRKAEALAVGRATVERSDQRIRDKDLEARLVTVACSQTDGGHTRWTMQMVAETVVQRGASDQISHTTVRVT
jgi:hypothetical protein